MPAEATAPGDGRRIRFLLALVATIAIGLVIVLDVGPIWVRTQVGGTLYVLAGIFGVLTLRPRLAPLPVAAAVLAATSLTELLQLWQLWQLWQPPIQQADHASTPGELSPGTPSARSYSSDGPIE